MSFDISLTIDTGNEYHTVWCINCTYNASKMWHKALKASGYDVESIITFFTGKTALEAQPILTKMIEDMKVNKKEYMPLEPKNGWGNYEIFIGVLEDWLEACIEDPNCKILIS